MEENTFLGRFLREAIHALQPLRDALNSPSAFNALMKELGWDVASQSATYTNLATAVNTIIADFAALPPEPDEGAILGVIDGLYDLYTAISALSGAPAPLTGPGATNFLATLPQELEEYLIVKYLNNYQRKAYALLNLFRVIRRVQVPATTYRAAYSREDIDWAAFGQLFANPGDTLRTALSWGTSTFAVKPLFELLLELFSRWNHTAYLYTVSSDNIDKYHAAFSNTDLINYGLYLNLFSIRVGTQFIPFGFHTIGAIGQVPQDFGLILRIDVPQGLSLQQDISDDLKLTISASFNTANAILIKLKPSGVDVKLLNGSIATIPEGKLELGFTYQRQVPVRLFGPENGSRLELEKIGVAGTLRWGDDPEIILEINLDGLKFIFSKEDFDGFIKKIFGDDNKEINIPLALRWSSKAGLSFKGSGSLELSIPQNLKLGPVTVSGIKISLRKESNPDAVTASLSCDVAVKTGVLDLTVSGLGVKLGLILATSNAGIFGIRAGVKSPTGVGIAINAEAVKGGGFLNFDEATSTYTGALELTFSKISLKAIGILTTRLPGNQDGYSLLILITAEFTPIQLGLGFTLNGVGGLLGLNRTTNVDALRNGIRDNTLESILFPQNIVQNATTIISNLNNVFPIQKDRFLIGPMAKIGWGTPTLLTIDLGIIIELPSPVLLTILGVIKAVLPDKNKPVLTLQVNFLGVIDFDKKRLEFDATLYNSKILTFALAGDMALRLYWGDNPKFLITAGGFHPKFNPPPMNLPQLRRISISLVNTNNLKIGAETYFAITSNSAQFGARVAAVAKAWKIEAVGALWFDVLFQFSPFYFVADMGVMFSIRLNGKERLTIFVDFKLEGPNPWRAQGRGEFRICGIKVRVSFDKTFGQARTEVITAVSAWPKLEAAIQHKDNWSVEGPTRIQPLVAYKEVSLTPGDLLADPFGTFRFNQKVVPLNTTISKFGTAGVNDYERFAIDPVAAGTTTLPTESTQDYFARNEFFYMTDDEKLSRESYEKFNSGMRIGNTDALFSEFFTLRAVEYDEIFIDTRYRRRLKDFTGTFAHLTLEAMESHTFANYVTRSTLSDFKNQTPDGGPRKATFSAAEEGNYVLADRNSLTQVSGTGSYLNYRQAEEQLASLQTNQPSAAAEYIIVNSFEL